MSGRAWSPAEDALLRREYPFTRTAELAPRIARSVSAVHQRARTLGLRKAPEVIAAWSAQAIADPDHGARKTQLKRGVSAWNKGIKGSTGHPPNVFRPGNLPQTWVPVGTTRLDERDGYLVRKVSDTRDRKVDWRPLHVLAWEAENGPVPAGHVVVFKPGRKTIEEAAITPDAVECISRRDLMLRNTYHRYGPEVAKLVQLRGAITRQINKRAKHEQDSQ